MADLADVRLSNSSAARALATAVSFLTYGPPLSMNIPLEDGEELPECMHTMLQGTVWAVLMSAGADPDLEGAEYQAPDYHVGSFVYDYHYLDVARCHWFLCKKTFFAHRQSIKDGIHHQLLTDETLTVAEDDKGGSETLMTNLPVNYRIRIHKVVSVYSNGFNTICTTPHGIYVWGSNIAGSLAHQSGQPIHPTRLTFPEAPNVAQCEAIQPIWHKDRLVERVFLGRTRFITILVTAAGAVCAGDNVVGVEGAGRQLLHFAPFPLPDGFVPDHAMIDYQAVFLRQGRTAVAMGENTNGQLGLGHRNVVRQFETVPMDVEQIWHFNYKPATLFLSSGKLYLVGAATDLLCEYLEGLDADDLALSPWPLDLPEVDAGYIDLSGNFMMFRRAGTKDFFGCYLCIHITSRDSVIFHFTVSDHVSEVRVGWYKYFIKVVCSGRGGTSEVWLGLGDNRAGLLADGPDLLSEPTEVTTEERAKILDWAVPVDLVQWSTLWT
ncbi:hypothetical protein J8273_6503 [Carpediemonas membranifera]|uniref:Uncharacterized protein n=1 Tax=Carpediemonas membranifera TaxID=201153 RepID=A0A8J6B2R3_9EUKA|nr:hypothetical protein J8273_6503 [Carpediemonas membranifera]|eukprot:KAG9391727.1 hypothetical protein J8273_6503 [Carpediemonas membranifera]